MSKRLDLWNPSEQEIDEVIGLIEPERRVHDEPVAVERRRENEVVRKRFLGRLKGEEKVPEGKCAYCERETKREFCGMECEREAALAPLRLKFRGCCTIW